MYLIHITIDLIHISVPLGYLKQNHKTLFITPSLPIAKEKALNSISFGTICKVFLEFDNPLPKVNLILTFYRKTHLKILILESKSENNIIFYESSLRMGAKTYYKLLHFNVVYLKASCRRVLFAVAKVCSNR